MTCRAMSHALRGAQHRVTSTAVPASTTTPEERPACHGEIPGRIPPFGLPDPRDAQDYASSVGRRRPTPHLRFLRQVSARTLQLRRLKNRRFVASTKMPQVAGARWVHRKKLVPRAAPNVR